MVMVKPLPIATGPVLVKLGVVPDWVTVRLPPLREIEPLLRWSEEPRLTVRGWPTLSVPWLSIAALRLRAGPPWLPATALIDRPAALISVPLVTLRVAVREELPPLF